MRKVHIGEDNIIWEYSLGKSFIVIKSPDGKKFTLDYSKLTGWNWSNIERAQDKKVFSITPFMVKAFIEENLIVKR